MSSQGLLTFPSWWRQLEFFWVFEKVRQQMKPVGGVGKWTQLLLWFSLILLLIPPTPSLSLSHTQTPSKKIPWRVPHIQQPLKHPCFSHLHAFRKDRRDVLFCRDRIAWVKSPIVCVCVHRTGVTQMKPVFQN